MLTNEFDLAGGVKQFCAYPGSPLLSASIRLFCIANAVAENG